MLLFAVDWKKVSALTVPWRENTSTPPLMPDSLLEALQTYKRSLRCHRRAHLKVLGDHASQWRLSTPPCCPRTCLQSRVEPAVDHRFMVIPVSHITLGVGVPSYTACRTEVEATCHFSGQCIKIKTTAAVCCLWKGGAKLHRIQTFHSVSTAFSTEH